MAYLHNINLLMVRHPGRKAIIQSYRRWVFRCLFGTLELQGMFGWKMVGGSRKTEMVHPTFRMSGWKLGSLVRITGLFHLHLNGIYSGYYPLIRSPLILTSNGTSPPYRDKICDRLGNVTRLRVQSILDTMMPAQVWPLVLRVFV